MDFKLMLAQLSQLSESTKETEKGRIHKADPGGYGRKVDADDDGDDDGEKKKKAQPAVKRGRGRPKKGADSDTGQVAKYDNAKNLQSFMVGNIPKKGLPGKPGKKHSLKEWVQEIENKYVAEGSLNEGFLVKNGAKYLKGHPSGGAPMSWVTDPTKATVFNKKAEISKYANMRNWSIVPATQKVSETIPGQQLTVKPMPGAAQLVDPATQKVMATGDAASVKNIQGAVAQGKVQMRGAQEEMAEGDEDYSAKKARAGKDIGKPGKQFSKIAKSAGERYGSKERGEKVAGAVLSKLRNKVSEADIPSDQMDMGAGLGAGRSQRTFEGKMKEMDMDFKELSDQQFKKKYGKTKDEMKKSLKQPATSQASNSKVTETAKPDYIDLDKDGNKKETMKKAVSDKKKKKVNESGHKHTAARLLGKHHALAKEAYNCKYEDMEEAKMYHEGYKEGLDECYGQMPIQGLVGEMSTPATVPGMASATMSMPSMEEDMFDEGNAFTAALARTPAGGKFKVGGNTFTDRSGYDSGLDETFMAFESWDKELNALLNEGMTVSISKGQEGSPDSVSVTAQDAEADQLLAAIKQAGLGLFGAEEPAADAGVDPEQVTGMSVGGEESGRDSSDIGVVDDHDDMMSLIKKIVGGGDNEPEEVGAGSDEGHDYEGEESSDEEGSSEESSDEEGSDDHDHEGEEETCEGCNMKESDCECEEVDETESYDQEEEEVAEDSEESETTADENAEASEDQALAKADELNEWANDAGQKGTDESFDMDIAFITKAISGGLNKEKSTGQTTTPVIPGQNDRMGYSATNESLNDWKKLAGLR